MNHYSWWTYLLVACVILFGVIYAAPNLFGEDPAIQLSAKRGATVDTDILEETQKVLAANQYVYKSAVLEENRILIRFSDPESQLKAQDLLQSRFPEMTIALNLAPSTPAWLRSLGAAPMYLGLDLRGGVHFLMEVDMDAAVAQAIERFEAGMRTSLRESKLRYSSFKSTRDGRMVIAFDTEEKREVAYKLLAGELNELRFSRGEEAGSFIIQADMEETTIAEIKDFALKQNIITLRNRINELGVAEPVIQQQGKERIVVQLPGVQDTARAKEIIGATATLEFRLVDLEADIAAARASGARSRLYKDRQGREYLLKRQVILKGESITNAASGFDNESGQPLVHINIDGKGSRLFSKVTGENIGKPLSVVFIENKVETIERGGKLMKKKSQVRQIINVATIRDQLGRRFQITGLDSPAEARDLALLLRAGSLAAPIEIVEERTVGPSLGQQNIDQGFRSVVVGFALVLLLMLGRYRMFGLFANVALTLNLVLIVAVLSLLQATLTLPGIAGIVLTVGMAVDANVLIFERIREELALGNSPQASIHAGYEKAFSSILDANVTTLIASLVLFSFGTGPVKGFAITLSIGILTSMFTAIIGTRAMVNALYGGKRLQRVAIGGQV